jgi:hypothetical protein
MSGETCDRKSGVPPESGTFRISSRATKPTHSPSGEKNGRVPSSVPSIGSASALSRPRR